MMKKVSERELKQAATVLWEEWKTFLETIEPHDPSPEFDARMHHLIEQKQQEIKLREKEKKRRIRHRVAVAAVLVLAILLGWLLIDQTAYAKVSKWFKSIVGSHVNYSFTGDVSREELPVVRLGEIPAGAAILKDEVNKTTNEYELLLSFEDGTLLYFRYGYMHDGLLIRVDDLKQEKLDMKTIMIGKYLVECYLNVDNTENDYFWMDEERNLYFTLASFLPHEKNLNILDSIDYQYEGKETD